MAPMGKMLMLAGGALFVVGLLVTIGGRFGLGHLPGDIAAKRGNSSFYFPVVTCIALSVGLSLLLNFLSRLWR